MTEKEIMKLAFNQGYELQKSDPDLARKIASAFSDPNIPYADGFISGAIEFIKEIGKSPETYMAKLKANESDRDISL